MRTRVRPLAECGGTKIMATGGNKSTGFTIVETLIVLAVSGFLAVATMLAISGRQSRTQFTVAANNIKQNIEQIINETRSGYYPQANDFRCYISGGAVTIDTLAHNDQGTNDSCIFVGKAVEFDATSPEIFSTYPLVGRRQITVAGVTREVDSYTEAKPIALAPDSSNNTNGVDHSESFKTDNGLQFVKATYWLSSGAHPPATRAVFAFADGLGAYIPDAATGELNSGTEKLNLYYFSGSPVWGGPVVDGINAGNINDTGATLDKLDLCFDGGTGKSATVSIAGKGQLSVKLKLSNLAC